MIRIAWSYTKYTLSLYVYKTVGFQNNDTIFHSHQHMSSICHAFLSSVAIVRFFFLILATLIVVSQCGFNLYFPNDILGLASFIVAVGQPCIFFGQMSAQIFGLF